MPKLEVVSHEYDEAADIDTFVFNPGNMEAMVKVVESGGEPQVLLGVRGLTFEYNGEGEVTWSKCPNPAIAEAALECYRERKGQ